MEIRTACKSDASEICQVLRRSIAELCHDDHRDDPKILDEWLRGKTPETVTKWITNPENEMLVATLDGKIAGTACRRGNQITLNYVSPGARFLGVSHALLMALEDRIREGGGDKVMLESTTTALQFYQSRGYRQYSEQQQKFGMVAWPLIKQFRPGSSSRSESTS